MPSKKFRVFSSYTTEEVYEFLVSADSAAEAERLVLEGTSGPDVYESHAASIEPQAAAENEGNQEIRQELTELVE